jgi:hypothetical protein
VIAAGFEAPAGKKDFEAVTAFEALEHMTDPMAFIREAIGRSRTRTLIFTTELFKGAPPPPDWWYYAFAAGQHISFFTRTTCTEIARRLNLNFVSASGMHMLTGLPVAQWHYSWTVKNAKRGWLHGQVQRGMRSRTQADHEAMLRRLAEEARPFPSSDGVRGGQKDPRLLPTMPRRRPPAGPIRPPAGHRRRP